LPNGSGSTAGTNFAVKMTRVGRVVTLTFATSITADPAGTSTYLTLKASGGGAIAIPSGFLNSSLNLALAAPIVNNGSDSAGEVVILTTGEVRLYLYSGAFTNGTDVAGLYATSITYTV
jgi:hypothetical protein